MNNSYITIIKEKRTALSRKRIPLNQNGCTANFRIGVPFEQNLQDWLKEQDIYDISVTEDNESEGYKKMYYERNPEKEEKDEFYDTDDTAYIPFERLVYEGDVISYTDSSIETVTEVEENGDFYTKITSMPKLPLKNTD